MRKSFNTYLVIWAIALILFNLVIFVIPSSLDGKTIVEVANFISYIKTGSIDIFKITADDIVNGLALDLGNVQKGLDFDLVKFADFLLNSSDKEIIFNKYAGAFWPSYVCIMFAFIGQLVCAVFAFKETNSQKFFYKIPLITISYTGLIFTLIFGVIGMFFPDFPIWLAVAICVIIFVITLISILRSKLVATVVSEKDDELAKKLSFSKELLEDVRKLYETNKENINLKKLFEETKYADPMKLDSNKDIILSKLNEIKVSINDNDKLSILVTELKEIFKK